MGVGGGLFKVIPSEAQRWLLMLTKGYLVILRRSFIAAHAAPSASSQGRSWFRSFTWATHRMLVVRWEWNCMATRKPENTAEERRRRRQARDSAIDQFAALGRFIQKFENILVTLRLHAHRMLMGFELGNKGPDGNIMPHWGQITSLIFHHEAMTAKPLADIWRSLLAEHSRALKKLGKISAEGEDVAREVSSELHAEFVDIYTIRNRLIHATWRIGFWTPFEDVSQLGVQKYVVGKDGLGLRTDLPGTFDELFELGTRCERFRGRLTQFIQTYRFSPEELEKVFIRITDAKKGERWKFVPPSSSSSKQSRGRRR